MDDTAFADALLTDKHQAEMLKAHEGTAVKVSYEKGEDTMYVYVIETMAK